MNNVSHSFLTFMRTKQTVISNNEVYNCLFPLEVVTQ